MGLKSRRGLAGFLVLSVLASGLAGLAAPSPALAAGTCDGVAGSETQAAKLAVSCREPVVVDGSRTELSQVVAQPDGHLRFESAVVPQRARKAGQWSDINLDLGSAGGGRLRPVTSVADVTFSGDGTGPLVRLVRDGRTMEMSWPSPLTMAPTVLKDSVTYKNVMPDVDLILRATRTGFAHALVVKSAAAAALPGVREVRFRLGGDAELRQASDGLLAVAGNSVLASADPATMWDSRTTSSSKAQRSSAADSNGLDASTPAGAGDTARQAPVAVEVSGSDLVLRPDTTLLTAKDAALPLFVDPEWSVYKNRWAFANNNGEPNNAEVRVGRRPDTGALYRSFFQFPTTANGVSLSGKSIRSARVQMEMDHSYSCDGEWTSMYWTSAINASPHATWSKMVLSQPLAEANGHANEGGGCDQIQDDMALNFRGGTVDGFVQRAARERWSALTVGFTALHSGSGESTQSRWRKFVAKGAKLFVDYDTPPGQPNGLQIAGVGCPSSGVVTVGTLNPTFSAVFPDEDNADSLTATFEWIEVPGGGLGAVTDTSPGRLAAVPVKAGNTPGSRVTSSAVTVADKSKTYAFRAQGRDKPPYSLPSGWSGWCQFRVDTAVPDVRAFMLSTPPGPGQVGRVRIESSKSSVTTFQYGWDAATKPVPAQGSNPRYAEVEVTAPHFGRNVLFVKAIDATLNEGTWFLEVVVARPAPPVASWGLEAYPGASESAALSDRAAAPVDSALTASQVGWSDDARLWGGKSAKFNGSSSVAATDAAVVNTAGSFSVAAWVWLEALPAGDTTFAAQEGSDAAGFEVGVRRNGPSMFWSFTMKDTASQSSTTRAAMSPTSITAGDVHRWVHVAGVYDAGERQLRLYVDGTRVAQVDRAAGGWSSGRFVVGRGWASGAPTGWWNGSVADVQVFDRALLGQDFTGQLASDPASSGFDEPGFLTPIQVGGWNFETARECMVTDLKNKCQASDNTKWGRWLALSRGADVGSGRAGSQALWLDDKYFPANDGSSTESTQEYGRSAVMTGVTPPDDDGNQFTTWADRPAVRTDESFTLSAWVMAPDGLQNGARTIVSQTGVHESGGLLRYNGSGRWEMAVSAADNSSTPTQTVVSDAPASANVWTQLVGVYDAGARQLRLYVNGVLQGPRSVSFTPMVSTGPLVVGRTRFDDQLVDQWVGGVDDVAAFQGAMTDAAVANWYHVEGAESTGGNLLAQSQTMAVEESLRSNNGDYELRMQSDGNLVFYDRGGHPLWDTGTWGHPGASVTMQSDGNLVVYGSDGHPLWSSETWGTGADRLVLFDNGDLLMLNGVGTAVWRTPDPRSRPGDNWSVLSGAIAFRQGPGATGTDPYEGSSYTSVRATRGNGSMYQDINRVISPGDTFCANTHVVTEGTAAGGGGSFALFLTGGALEVSNKNVGNLPNGNHWTPLSTCVTATSSHSAVRVQYYPAVGGPAVGIDAVDVHQSLAKNGGFNNGLGDWTVGANSNYATYGSGVTGNDPYEGTGFAATNTSGTSDGIFQDVRLTIRPGDTFCGTAQIATQGSTGGASGNFVLWLIGPTIMNSNTAYANAPGGYNWSPVSGCVTATANFDWLRVQFYPAANTGTTIIDAVDVHKSLAVNGGFNNGLGGWMVGANANYATYGPGVTGNDPYEGTGFAATNTSGTSDGIFQDVRLTIRPGDTFCGTAQIATQGSTGGASGNFVLWLIGPTIMNSSTAYANAPGGNNWSPVSGCVTATANFDWLRVQFYPAANTGTTIIDAVDVRQSLAVNGGLNGG